MGAGSTSCGIHCSEWMALENVGSVKRKCYSMKIYTNVEFPTRWMRSILEASYIANCVSWTTSMRVWSEWNCTRVSPVVAFPAGIWIAIDFLFSHVSMLHTHSCRDQQDVNNITLRTISSYIFPLCQLVIWHI